MKNKIFFVLLHAALLPLLGCLENPFGDDEISGGTRSVRGVVRLNNNASPQGAYVWLEGFNLGTQAGAQGEFTLTLPPAASQGGGGASGAFQVYFFLANYELVTSSVVTRNGAFLYDQGEINKSGELRNTKVLRQFLRISTQVSPSTVPANYNGTISVETTFEATIDTATVVFPNTIAGLLGAVLARRVGTNEAFIYQAVPGASNVETQRFTRAPAKRGMTMNFTTAPLPPGDYEIIPYILIRHQSVPSLLLASLGGGVEQLGQSYLNMPMKREGGQFKVTP
jgi:hypothetical protein